MTDPNQMGPAEGQWRPASLIATRHQSRHARTLVFRVPGWAPHLPGQHVEIRLTAPDGYTARRLYALAEPFSPDRVAITVDPRPHGEVSSYLIHTMQLGDQIDVRGPLDAGFSWAPDDPYSLGRPLVLLGADAGIVPLMTILRARAQAVNRPEVLLVYWTRDASSHLYRPDLDALGADVEVRVRYDSFVRTAPGSTVRQVDPEDLRDPAAWAGLPGATAYVSGPDSFVDEIAAALLKRGYGNERIRLQRFDL